MLQGLSVADLEARMLFQQQQQQQSQQTMQQHGAPPQRPHAQNAYAQSSGGLYSPSAAAALARLTQSTQQAQTQGMQGLSRNDLMHKSVLANQQQQQHSVPGPGYANRPGGFEHHRWHCHMVVDACMCCNRIMHTTLMHHNV